MSSGADAWLRALGKTAVLPPAGDLLPHLEAHEPVTTMRFCLFAFAFSTSWLTAQSSLTVPPNAIGRDGLGLSHLAGVTDSRRQQFIVGASLLPGLLGHQTGSDLRLWPIDVDRDGVRGQVTVFGQTCVQLPQSVTRHMSADPATLRAGSTMRVRGLARDGEPAVLLLAAQRLGSSINLGLIGSPMCELWVSPDLMLWTTAQPNTVNFPATANIYLHIPHDSAFLGAALHAQWLVVQGAALATSEGITLQLAASLARIDAAVVLSTPFQGSTPPSVGEVEVSAVPVMRIHYQ